MTIQKYLKFEKVITLNVCDPLLHYFNTLRDDNTIKIVFLVMIILYLFWSNTRICILI